jgi:hypothetical protein
LEIRVAVSWSDWRRCNRRDIAGELLEYNSNWRYVLLCLGVTGGDATGEILQEND